MSTSGSLDCTQAPTYLYDDKGIRISDGTTQFLYDSNNPTGYPQVLVSTASSGRKVATLGLDIIEGVDKAYTDGANGHTGEVYIYDGHGSRRLDLDYIATAATNMSEASETKRIPTPTISGTTGLLSEWYQYDAFGNVIIGDSTCTACYPTIGYSGELTDPTTGQQYLRARYYIPGTGRFNRVDPFEGDSQDPQSLHKYLYVHADPVNGVDPTGQFLSAGGLGSVLGSLAIQGTLRGAQLGAVGAVSGTIFGAIDAGLGGGDLGDILTGAGNGAIYGGAIGFGLGFLSPFAATLLPATVQAALIDLGAGATLAFGAYGAADSFSQGNAFQGIFRLGTSFLGAYSLSRAPIGAVRRTVNIGGEGEIANAINLQPRLALHRGHTFQRTGKNLAQHISQGDEFLIYNAQKQVLPFRSNSVPEIHSNSVPIDKFGGKPGGVFPAIKESEILRVLRPGAKWFHDGVLQLTKPNG
jgi:RHS repeat-associated protein